MGAHDSNAAPVMNAPESPLKLSPDAAAATTACYHCGLPVDGPVRYRVRVAGEDRPMCCAGCAAVACSWPGISTMLRCAIFT